MDDWHRFLDSISELEDLSTSSQAAVAMASRWLRCCVKSHARCQVNLGSGNSFSPTRLVYVGDGSQTEPRLVESTCLSEPYVALSHRWGIEGLPRTLLSNRKDRLKSIPLASLSPTMKDAISIVRDLGFRYLWMDALCIIQDSREDWLAEASKMSLVYSSAILTIAVADSENHTEGIFRPRRTHCIRPFHVDRFRDVPYRDRTWCDGEGECYVFPSTDKVQQGCRPKGPLDSRGWVLQEQLLSPRILYYGYGELHWDCITMSASESSPIATSLLTDDNPEETWALKVIRRMIVGATTIESLHGRIQDAWVQIIKNYSSRKLTKRQDKLIAMEGILRGIGAALGDEHIAGMWRTELWRQLLWWQDKLTSTADSQGGDSKFEAPTWSWLSANGPVFYHNSLQCGTAKQPKSMDKLGSRSMEFTELTSQARILNVQAKQLPLRMGLQGTLVLFGLCFKYRLSHNDMKKPIWKQWNKTKLRINPGRWVLDEEFDLPQEVECIIMAEDSVAKLLVCLCVVPMDRDGLYRRVGICHWEGMTHQITEFVAETPVAREIVIV